MVRYAVVWSLGVSLAAGAALAAEPANKGPAKPVAKAAGQARAAGKVTVVSVKGMAQQRRMTGAKGTWTPVKAGDVLDDRTVVRTGLGSQVVLDLADRGRVVVKSATKVGIGSFLKKNGRIKARLGMKYGAMRADIDSTHGPQDFQVKTAVATLSVRGTGGFWAFWGDFGLHLRGTHGRWNMRARGRQRHVRRGQQSDDQLTPPNETADQQRDTQMGDALGGLTDADATGLRDRGTGRGIFGFAGGQDNSSGIEDGGQPEPIGPTHPAVFEILSTGPRVPHAYWRLADLYGDPFPFIPASDTARTPSLYQRLSDRFKRPRFILPRLSQHRPREVFAYDRLMHGGSANGPNRYLRHIDRFTGAPPANGGYTIDGGSSGE